METKLAHSNVVVVARQFNPSIFSQVWLVRNEIATEADFDEGESIFTPPFIQVRSPRFVLLVLPEQLQFAPLPPHEAHGELVADKIGRIAQLLPETPYVAVGLNFHWMVQTEPEELAKFSRALFFRENPLYGQFAEENSRYGGYLSKDVLGVRLKLDVKPTTTTTKDEVIERLLLAFNFHVDIRDNPVDEVQQMVGRWNDASEHAAEIIEALETWQWQ